MTPFTIIEGRNLTEDSILNSLAKFHRRANEHWWRNPKTGRKLRNRNRPTMHMLMVSEIAEAMEGLRKDKMDDHLPQFKAEVVELADLYIRLMDYVGEYYPEEFGKAVVAKHEYNRTRSDHTNAARLAKGGKAF